MAASGATPATPGCHVVVTGLPASGKSTLARRLGPLLGLPVIDKDDILEQLLPVGPFDPDVRQALSRQADEMLRARVAVSAGAIVVSFWRRRELSDTSGTPWSWLECMAGVVEVHCVCSVDTAAERFRKRRRHPGHGDLRWDRDELRQGFALQQSLGPLGVGGHTFHVDTEGTVDAMALAALIRDATG